MRTLTVLAPGTVASLQDAGRPGWAHVGVGHSGAADRGSHHLANRLVGNPTDSATIECLLGGLTARADADVVVAVTGAPCPVRVNGRDADHHAPLYLRGGDELSLGLPAAGLRCYVAASGGFDVDPVLGSRSWDSLAGLGPAPLRAGAVLPLGQAAADGARVDHAPVLLPTLGTLTVTVTPGSREDWVADGLAALGERTWVVSTHSDRVGVRLDGVPLLRAAALADAELPSEGVVRGAVQVPAGGLPVVFGSDHPVTGGYPVVGVVTDADADLLAQARPGQQVRFRAAGITPRRGPSR